MAVNQDLKNLFEKSILIDKKLPSPKERSIFLSKLLKKGDKEKKRFIKIFQDFELRTEKEIKAECCDLKGVEKDMKKIKQHADNIYKRIENEEDLGMLDFDDLTFLQ
jgi:hypothetical protein